MGGTGIIITIVAYIILGAPAETMGGAVCTQLAQLLHLAHPGPSDADQVFYFFVFVHMCPYIHPWTCTCMTSHYVRSE